jgi:predicted RND superfamily exporter protein
MWRLTGLSLRHPAATLALLGVATLTLGAGAARLDTDAGYRAFLGSGHPAVRELDAFVARFGGGLPFAAVWSCAESPACESVFDADSLAMAHAVARRLEATPGVRRVDGPATSPLLAPVLFELPQARRLAPEGVPVEGLEALAARAVEDPTWVGQLVSADGAAGALLVHLESSDGAAGVAALRVLRELLMPWEARGFRFHLVGGPVEFVVAGGELARHTARLVPVMVALVAAVLVVLLRSWAVAALTLASVGTAVIWTLGLQGWLGWPQNSLSQVLAPLVLVIGVCDAMHVAASYASQLVRRPDAGPAERGEVLLGVVGRVGGPCLMTTLTTAAGFASFAVSGLESFVRFGWIAAAGVVAALVVSFTLLPIALVRLPVVRVGSQRTADAWGAGLERVVGLAARRPATLLGVAAAMGGLGVAGFGALRVDARFEDLYGEGSQVVRWTRAAARHLREPETLEIALLPPDGIEPHAPQALRVVEGVEALASLDGLGRALSILAPMRALHLLVHGAPLALDGSERSAERARHMLRLLRFEDTELVDLFLEQATGAYRVSLQSQKLPQDELRELLDQVERRVGVGLPPGWGAIVTGPLAVVGRMIDEIRRTQLESFALAGALILVLVALFFRSLGAAALALVPTALPVLLTLGSMGLAGIALDIGSAMVAAVVLGLAVDDAIHLLAAWRRRRRGGDDADLAIAHAVRDVGRPLVTTSLALATGFLALGLAPWQSISSFGLVAGIAILVALLADLLVLPALLVSWARLHRRLASPSGSA